MGDGAKGVHHQKMGAEPGEHAWASAPRLGDCDESWDPKVAGEVQCPQVPVEFAGVVGADAAEVGLVEVAPLGGKVDAGSRGPPATTRKRERCVQEGMVCFGLRPDGGVDDQGDPH